MQCLTYGVIRIITSRANQFADGDFEVTNWSYNNLPGGLPMWIYAVILAALPIVAPLSVTHYKHQRSESSSSHCSRKVWISPVIFHPVVVSMSRRRISAASWSSLLRRTQPPRSSVFWGLKVQRPKTRHKGHPLYTYKPPSYVEQWRVRSLLWCLISPDQGQSKGDSG